MELAVVLPGGTCDIKEQEAKVDEDIKDFEAWFTAQTKSDPLTKAEKAIIKDYLWWKLRG